MVLLARLNGMDRSGFVEAVGFAWERSPWVAEAAWERRPFADLADLHAAMVEVVRSAPRERQLALIRAHPDLAGRAAIEKQLTAESTREQSAAGLDRLTPEQFERFHRLNGAYRERFGFPFVICARDNTRESILAAFERRLASGADEEVATALGEIARIARLRLEDAVS